MTGGGVSLLGGDRLDRLPGREGVRGPRADGRVYWRARQGDAILWAGWATREEATAQGARLMLDQQPAADTARTVRDILEIWWSCSVNVAALPVPMRIVGEAVPPRAARNRPATAQAAQN